MPVPPRGTRLAARHCAAWLKVNAPASYASLLPPAPEQAIEAADAQLRHHLDFGRPGELGDLWRLCEGVEHQYIEADEEEGEVVSGAFLPGGALLGSADALWLRLPDMSRRDWWGAAVVPWLTGDQTGHESGHYVGANGVGHWSLPTIWPATSRAGCGYVDRPQGAPGAGTFPGTFTSVPGRLQRLSAAWAGEALTALMETNAPVRAYTLSTR